MTPFIFHFEGGGSYFFNSFEFLLLSEIYADVAHPVGCCPSSKTDEAMTVDSPSWPADWHGESSGIASSVVHPSNPF